MSLEKEIWDTLSGIDVKPLMDKTGSGIGYVSWSKVWGLLMEHYPRSEYEFEEKHHTVVGEDGPEDNVEVWCRLSITSNEATPPSASDSAQSPLAPPVYRTVTRQMWLPCMQSFGQFLPITNPNPRDVSDTRMRCFVKCAAMFGLGISAWSGDDYKEDAGLVRLLEFSKKKGSYRMGLWKTAIAIIDCWEQDDGAGAAEAWRECEVSEQEDLWIAETKGGFFTTKQKDWLREQTLEHHPANT